MWNVNDGRTPAARCIRAVETQQSQAFDRPDGPPHAWGLAVGYAAASIVAGYAAIQLSTAVVRRVRVRIR